MLLNDIVLIAQDEAIRKGEKKVPNIDLIRNRKEIQLKIYIRLYLWYGKINKSVMCFRGGS